MIKANEAIVGHWFNRKHGKGHTWTQLDESIVGKIFSDSKEYALDDFDPIPLSPEILEKCGFEKGAHTLDLNKHWFLGWEGFIYLQIEKEGEFKSEYICVRIEFKDCQHLHQLQNLFFSLSGEELQIQL